MQRLLDIVFSALAVLILLPLFIPIGLLLRFTGEGEIFFLQPRVGCRGQIFGLFKFATMLKDSPNMGSGTVTMKNDPRVLPFGKFLRDTKINELPQLLNILIGHMSFIGPRPLTQQVFSGYPPAVAAIIQQVRPGLSGIGSIVFHHEEEILAGENSNMNFYREVILPYKGELEIWYVNHQGLSTYFKAILLTVWVVVFHKATVAWKVFRGLPVPPVNLRKPLDY